MSDPNIVNPGESSYSLPKPETSAVGDVPQMPLERTLPRQVSTGTMRGTQTVAGEQNVSDPTTNNPVIATSGITQNTVYSDPKTQVKQIVLGNFGDGSYGMKVAQPGYDVLTATDNQLIFNSSQNVFKIVDIVTGTYVITVADAAASQASFSFPHNLGFKPTVYGSFTTTTNSNATQLPFNFYSTSKNYFGATAPSAYVGISSIDNANINVMLAMIDIYGLGLLAAASTMTFKFYCLQESII